MAIWGHRDSEPQPEKAQSEEAHQAEPRAHETQDPAGPEDQAEEPAPAFWRAQGQTPASVGREPADAPPLAYGQAAEEAPVVVLDGETAAKDQSLTRTTEDQASSAHDTQTGDQAPAEAQVPGAGVTDAPEPAVAEPTVAVAQVPEGQVPERQAPEGQAPKGREPAATSVPEPAVAEPSVSPAGAAPGSADAAAAQQRWSEILVSFVDDPRGSVTMAAGAVDEAVDEVVSSIRARQRALASSWPCSTQADTEQLRTVLRDYRKLWHQVRQLDLGQKTSG